MGRQDGEAATAPTRLVVARVRGLHGLRGAVRVEVLTDRPEDRFRPGRILHREGLVESLTIVDARPVEDGPGWRLRFREIADRTAAERLRDNYLETAVDRALDLPPGAAYWHEVIGVDVRDLEGQSLGTVADVYRVGEAEVLVVEGGPPGPFDLPVVAALVREFTPERGRIVVDAAALDLGAGPVDEPAPRRPRSRPRWSRHGAGAHGRGPATDGSPAGAVPPKPGPVPPGPMPRSEGAPDLVD